MQRHGADEVEKRHLAAALARQRKAVLEGERDQHREGDKGRRGAGHQAERDEQPAGELGKRRRPREHDGQRKAEARRVVDEALRDGQLAEAVAEREQREHADPEHEQAGVERAGGRAGSKQDRTEVHSVWRRGSGKVGPRP